VHAVVFTMDRPERQKLTTALIEHFELAEWRQRAHQWLNPHFATSFSAGWRGICGCIRSIDDHGKPVPRQRVYEWIGEWEDTHGNVIAYSLIAEGTGFRGYASYTPHRIIRRKATSSSASSRLESNSSATLARSRGGDATPLPAILRSTCPVWSIGSVIEVRVGYSVAIRLWKRDKEEERPVRSACR
jgi:hypothetical protein